MSDSSGSDTETPKFRIIYSSRFLKHRAPGSHPERPERLTSCLDALNNTPTLKSQVDIVEPTELSEVRREKVMNAVLDIHKEDYVDELRRVAEKGGGGLDADTYVHPESYEIALLAVSAWMDAVSYAIDKGAGAFALARPPGHHATPSTGMGFCLLSNAAIAAKYALKRGLKNIAILDFDVHHGNGTEACIQAIPEIRLASSHEYPLYPGTGKADFTGKVGNIRNITLNAGCTMKEYESKYDEEILPWLLENKPELVIVSCGYDALEVDPLAQLEWQPKDYGMLMRKLIKKVGRGKVVLGLEGGYELDGIGKAFVETVRACCEEEKAKEKEEAVVH